MARKEHYRRNPLSPEAKKGEVPVIAFEDLRLHELEWHTPASPRKVERMPVQTFHATLNIDAQPYTLDGERLCAPMHTDTRIVIRPPGVDDVNIILRWDRQKIQRGIPDEMTSYIECVDPHYALPKGLWRRVYIHFLESLPHAPGDFNHTVMVRPKDEDEERWLKIFIPILTRYNYKWIDSHELERQYRAQHT
ncbi:MAG: hypothetical protein KIH62_001950 [Candidatus Kerfeldbacteria bacterium]|nr:hypothetical protein [Candidatus Kerfeldbacteria bacterium]